MLFPKHRSLPKEQSLNFVACLYGSPIRRDQVVVVVVVVVAVFSFFLSSAYVYFVFLFSFFIKPRNLVWRKTTATTDNAKKH